MTVEPLVEDYDKRIEAIDEQICDLINQRKNLSSNPGLPTSQHITAWSKKYNFYEDFLNELFNHFLLEDIFKPIEEPKGYRKMIPILKSHIGKDVFYSVTFVRQYENVSLVHLIIDKDATVITPEVLDEFNMLELSIEGSDVKYNCRNTGGSGSGGHSSLEYIVSPSLPDDMSAIEFMFKEYNDPFKRKPTGLEFVITIDN